MTVVAGALWATKAIVCEAFTVELQTARFSAVARLVARCAARGAIHQAADLSSDRMIIVRSSSNVFQDYIALVKLQSLREGVIKAGGGLM